MKKHLIILLAIAVATVASAQHRPENRGAKKAPAIENIIPDLSAAQKRKLKEISSSSQPRIEALRRELKGVRDSLHTVMECYGDHSDVVIPLFEREAALQLELNKEFYRTKVRTDKVITKEQHKAFREKVREHRKARHAAGNTAAAPAKPSGKQPAKKSN